MTMHNKTVIVYSLVIRIVGGTSSIDLRFY